MGRKKKTEPTNNLTFMSRNDSPIYATQSPDGAIYTNIVTTDVVEDLGAELKDKIKEAKKSCKKRNEQTIKDFESRLERLDSIYNDRLDCYKRKLDDIEAKNKEYMQYQEDTEKINDFCKKTKIKYNGIESYRLVLNKLYELALKDRIQELKSMLKAVKAKDYCSCYTLDRTKKCISELDRYEDRQFYNSRLERLERIKKYREELQWKIK